MKEEERNGEMTIVEAAERATAVQYGVIEHGRQVHFYMPARDVTLFEEDRDGGPTLYLYCEHLHMVMPADLPMACRGERWVAFNFAGNHITFRWDARPPLEIRDEHKYTWWVGMLEHLDGAVSERRAQAHDETCTGALLLATLDLALFAIRAARRYLMEAAEIDPRAKEA